MGPTRRRWPPEPRQRASPKTNRTAIEPPASSTRTASRGGLARQSSRLARPLTPTRLPTLHDELPCRPHLDRPEGRRWNPRGNLERLDHVARFYHVETGITSLVSANGPSVMLRS